MHHCEHHHDLKIEGNAGKTLFVIIITIIAMTAEVIFGYLTNSMALLSDGWHMGTHAFALSITFGAYIFINRAAKIGIPNISDKISALAGYTSSLFLGITGIWVIIESVLRFFNPLDIVFNSAILVAVIGLFVNGICLLIMESKEKDKDYNFKAAYLHILTDALTSIFAITALLAGKFFGLYFLDPIMGIVGGILILRWSADLIKETSKVLLGINKKHHLDEHNHCYTH